MAMTHDVSRDEFEALKQRVEELENQLEDTSVEGFDSPALDRRDRVVLNHMKENGRRSKIALVQLYISLTDVQSKSTAKRRAKALEKTEAYANL